MLLVQGWTTCGIWRPGHIYFGQIASRTPSHDLHLAQKLLTMSLILVHPLCLPEHTRMVSHRDVSPGHGNQTFDNDVTPVTQYRSIL